MTFVHPNTASRGKCRTVHFFRPSVLLVVGALGMLLNSGAAQGALRTGTTQVERWEPREGARICLLGNALAERMQHDGWLEQRLQIRLPGRRLSFRNLGFGADELGVHQRTMNFGKFSEDGMLLDLPGGPWVPWDRYLQHEAADEVWAFFGYNESFAGAEGLDAFRSQLEDFVQHLQAQRYNGEGAPRLVLFSSIPQENLGNRNLPDGSEHNRRIELYNEVMAALAGARGIPYVDLFGPMSKDYATSPGPLTINGIHLNREGNRILAGIIEEKLLGPASGQETEVDEAALLATIREKNELWFQHYRATDGYNVYGGRSRLTYQGALSEGTFANFDVLQRELDHLDDLAANRDQAIWNLAQGQDFELDDSHAIPLLTVATNKRGKGEGGKHEYLTGEQALELMSCAPGMEVNLFADEARFPELVNPVQMAWDTRGRLWVAVWPTYPHWTPDRPMNDKLLILEDTDGDGRADDCRVFADGLHNPTGFEFWMGGVLLAQVPDLVFLKDSDGDDRADTKERLLHGLSSADTHHSANSFVMGPDGALYFQEGTFHQTQIESIYGPVRNHNGCVWRFEPRTFRVERYIPYNFANPHGHVFDRWGQDFVTDGTGNVNYYALPFSGFIAHPAKHAGYFSFFRQRSRPAGGTEILSSTHFPAENQQNYLIANVIGFRGVFQYEIHDAGSGFTASEVAPLLESRDQNFRPVDLEVGPDGAVYVLDWHNAIIGHMQHHLRDPSRDVTHGRVYRVTHAGRPLSRPLDLSRADMSEVLDQLKSPEDRVRYRARIELSGRDTDAVLIALRDWIEGLDRRDADYGHHRLEALWLHQQHNRMDRGLLVQLLGDDDPRVRAAATRVLRYGRRQVPDALGLLKQRARDDDARVRLEAVVAASSFDSARAAGVALEALRLPTDRFIDYALGETMRALEPRWKAALRAGESVVGDNPFGLEYLLGRVTPEELVHMPRVPAVLSAILTRHGLGSEARLAAARELAAASGASVGAEILGAIQAVDAGSDPHAGHILHALGGLLGAEMVEGARAGLDRKSIASLAAAGKQSATRALGYRLLVALDGSIEAVWGDAAVDAVHLCSLLEAVPDMSEDPRWGSLAMDLAERIQPVMFAPPEALAGEQAGTGLEVMVFEPAPADARAQTFDALSPTETVHTASFGLDLEVVSSSDSFGLDFRGTLFVPRSGVYHFTTTSDDGSRLFIDGRCVVENDGAHGMVEREGEIELKAGPHPVRLTYFEQGGAQGLRVTWEGPGLERELLPATALGSGGSRSLRAAAIRAMAHIPGQSEAKLSAAERLLGEGRLLGPTTDLLESVDLAGLGPESILPVLDTLAAHVAELPAQDRTLPTIAAALEVGRRMTRALPDAQAARSLSLLDGLGGSIILIRTLPHQMRYDLSEFWVEAGKPAAIVFQNNDMMPHNLVITIPGALAEVGEAAETLSAASGSQTVAFVPESRSVLWHTELLLPGESERLAFVAPEEEGEHPFLCTYPGHWRVMNGTMHVVEEIAPEQRIVRQGSGEEAGPVREFVADWSLADLLPQLGNGWEQRHSPERGRGVFEEAGCIKCHTIQGQGTLGGPDLTDIGEKFQGAELLRQVLEPSLEILEEYRFWGFDFESGPSVIGRVLEEDREGLVILPNLLEPDIVIDLVRDEIVEQWDTRLSPMPTGLLVTFEEDEILDLLSYLMDPGASEEKVPKQATEELQATRSTPLLWQSYPGGQGPGQGKHVVLLAGDEEYRSEEALPMLARILSQRHGFRCTVLFATDRGTGLVNPEEQTRIPGMEQLDGADMLVCFLRFRELPDGDMAHFVRFVESGKPILGLRTATHAFDYKRNPASPFAHYGWRSEAWPGGFGQQILGDTWVAHHGRHGSQSTRGVIDPGQEQHPILRGVHDVWGPTDVYAVRNLDQDQATVLLRGQVLRGMDPSSPPVEGPQNNPMMPIVWTRELDRADGASQRVVCSTIGASVDLSCEDLRRLLVNAVYWGLGLEEEISPRADVEPIRAYRPSGFGFGKFRRGQRAADF